MNLMAVIYLWLWCFFILSCFGVMSPEPGIRQILEFLLLGTLLLPTHAICILRARVERKRREATHRRRRERSNGVPNAHRAPGLEGPGAQ